MQMNYHRIPILLLTLSLASFNQQIIAETTLLNSANEKQLTLEQQLGKNIFFDTKLSSPAGQSCASCHDIKTSLTDPDQNLPVSSGAVAGRTGTRNTPSAAYSAFAPNFHFNAEEGLFIGGQFLDGRAANLQDQAKGPFLNPDEMNNADAQSVIEKIEKSDYADLFKLVFGTQIFNDPRQAFDKMAQAIVAFENTPSFNRFSSKYDYYLAGRTELSDQEQLGLEIFEDEDKANCAACHNSKTEDSSQPLFTDFTYDNLGTPANPEILALKGKDFVDFGLGATIGSEENGKFKVPSLRNVAKTAPYMHNGVFTNLHEVVDFYNTRDVDDKWPAPEVAANVNTEELGDLKLTDAEVNALIAFMQTLTDGYQFQKQATFSATEGIIEIPYLRAEGANQANRYYSVQLKQTHDGEFEIKRLSEISINNDLMTAAIPYYSFDTGLLEIPLLTRIDDSRQLYSYIAQLKYIPATDKKMKFELLYAKEMQ